MPLLHHVEWTPSLLGCLLSACTRQRSMNVGCSIHAHIIKRRGWWSWDLYVHNHLLNLYVKCHKLEWAHRLFDIMPNKNTVSWTVLVSGYDQCKRSHTALHLFSLMLKDPASPPNHFTFASALCACAKQECLSLGMQLHSHVFQRGFLAHVMVSNVLISLYMACRQVVKAEVVFQEILKPDQVSWNSLVSGLSQNNLSHVALDKFQMMRKSGLGATCFSLSAAIAACLDDEADLKRLHGLAIKTNLNLDSYIGCAMIRMYSKFNSMENAMEVFASLRLEDVASWNSLIEGYAECDQKEKGLQVFAAFLESGLEPDDITITSVLGICANLVMLDYGRQIHSLSIKTGLKGRIRVENSIIHMYPKCGSIEDGIKFFNFMKQRSLVSWTAMMGGLAQHGRAEEVIQLFHEMNREGLKPNKVTYTCVLSACNHAGLVDLGWSLFESMEIEPDIDHFICIVHMLVGGGRFKEVEEFIQRSSAEHRNSLWLTFLVACKNRGEWVQGASVADKMMTVGLPSEPFVLVLFSNIFAAAGRWDEVSKLREEMQIKGLKKEPGCSWLEKEYFSVPEDESTAQAS
ncbi:pentatricopeptide repeat-containing protein At2g33680-like isoform X1 [Macadamia integrifolia]|uniref:pentatricopeptide repeat-containing protein At2g33680-like isoform X1 n=1 Tax=Macadamia integrifolia TaxID=60698 RepID=UPI001C4FAE0C|nr:pentatricopeptide repeat-containing protein At2g33680-like isoform X1 [Macadamia integrifolia]